jgi:hypothetical protein
MVMRWEMVVLKAATKIQRVRELEQERQGRKFSGG